MEKKANSRAFRGSLKERDHLKDNGVDGVTFNRILKK